MKRQGEEGFLPRFQPDVRWSLLELKKTGHFLPAEANIILNEF